MATIKLTKQRGKNNLKDVVVAAGSAEAQSDTISVNIDFTKMTKGDVIGELDLIRQKVFASKWPML